MTSSHIKASEVEVGGFYLSANTNWPYVREVTYILDDFVTYNDYAYQTGESGFVNKGCTMKRFVAWAARRLTEEVALMCTARAHALAHEQAAAAFIGSPQGLRMVASWLALAVRNEIEDFHAADTEQTIKNTDKYMSQFNRCVRNSIYTGLYSILHSCGDVGAKHYVDFISRVPDYWEEPELMPELEKLRELGD